MTINNAARLASVQDVGVTDEEPEALERLRDVVLGLLAGLDRPPASLRISTNRVELELKWPRPEPAVVAPVAPVAPVVPVAAEITPGSYLTAHSVGVFYRSPEPGAKPFVDVGDVVVPGQQIGLIEAMKLMIPVESDIAGHIVEVLAADGAAVEYGDRLFAVEPAGS